MMIARQLLNQGDLIILVNTVGTFTILIWGVGVKDMRMIEVK